MRYGYRYTRNEYLFIRIAGEELHGDLLFRLLHLHCDLLLVLELGNDAEIDLARRRFVLHCPPFVVKNDFVSVAQVVELGRLHELRVLQVLSLYLYAFDLPWRKRVRRERLYLVILLIFRGVNIVNFVREVG